MFGKKLKDSIINFGENLPETELTNAIKHSMESDLRLILGTSMRVAPANKLPFEEMENGKKKFVVLVNLQKTPMDSMVDLRVWSKTDDFLKLVMKELGIEVEEYKESKSKEEIFSSLNNIIIDDSE